jgi:hypothetical protein
MVAISEVEGGISHQSIEYHVTLTTCRYGASAR